MKKILSILPVFALVVMSFIPVYQVSAVADSLYTGSNLAPSSPVQNNTISASRSGIASSCSNLSGRGLGGLVDCFIGALNDAVLIIISLTVVVILIGGFKMISSEEKREEGKNTLIYGVIGLAVMVSVWGLVNIVISTLGIGGQGPIAVPELRKP